MSPEEEEMQVDAMKPPVDPGNLQSEEDFEEVYPPPRKRLTKLTRKNPITGQLEQYQKGGRVKANYPVNLEGLARGGTLKSDYERMIIPPGNPRDHFRGMPKEMRDMYGIE
jgi:hypothetical protein